MCARWNEENNANCVKHKNHVCGKFGFKWKGLLHHHAENIEWKTKAYKVEPAIAEPICIHRISRISLAHFRRCLNSACGKLFAHHATQTRTRYGEILCATYEPAVQLDFDLSKFLYTYWLMLRDWQSFALHRAKIHLSTIISVFHFAQCASLKHKEKNEMEKFITEYHSYVNWIYMVNLWNYYVQPIYMIMRASYTRSHVSTFWME